MSDEASRRVGLTRAHLPTGKIRKSIVPGRGAWLVTRPAWVRMRTTVALHQFTPRWRQQVIAACTDLEVELSIRAALIRLDEVCADLHATPAQSVKDPRFDEIDQLVAALTDAAQQIRTANRDRRAVLDAEAAQALANEAALPTVTDEITRALREATEHHDLSADPGSGSKDAD